MLKALSKVGLVPVLIALLAGAHLHAEESSHSAPAGHGEAHGEHAAPIEEGRVIKTRALPKDFLVPSQLWDKVLGQDTSGGHGAAAAAGGGHGAPETPDEPGETSISTLLFSSIKVVLTEKNPGVLKNPILTFEFPKGGGEIDLSEWTTGQPGGLFVKFVLPSENPAGLQAYHFSKARKRKIDGRIYGGGCRSFYKVTDQIQKPGDKRGIPLNTTRSFHVSTLGGHFIFSWPEGDGTQVTQVNFTSSRDPELFCQSQASVKEPIPASGHSEDSKAEH